MNTLRLIGGFIGLIAIAVWIGLVFGALDRLRESDYTLFLSITLPPLVTLFVYAIKNTRRK